MSNQADSSSHQTSIPNPNHKKSRMETRSPLTAQALPQTGYQGGLNVLHYATNRVYSVDGRKLENNRDMRNFIVPNGLPYQSMQFNNSSTLENTISKRNNLDRKTEMPQDDSR
uniref:Uncharacterized protein n=1 Tax=Eucampia antarctica TaxID=49252 RepID=A0A7S2R2V7_9STRA